MIAVAAIAWDLVLFAAPGRVGTALLSSAWDPARSVLLPVTIAMAASGVMGAAVIGMRALAAARLSLRSKLIATPLIVAAGVTAAALWGAGGAAWGMAVGYPIGACVCWLHFRRALLQGAAGRGPVTPVDRAIHTVGAPPGVAAAPSR
jgi:hypothetical protein